MKKVMPTVLGFMLVIALAACSPSRENAEAELWKISGRYCETVNGNSLLLAETEGAISISPVEDKDLFVDLENGDKIEIWVDSVLETYPCQAKVYRYTLIEKGTNEDLDFEEVQELNNLGWEISLD